MEVRHRHAAGGQGLPRALGACAIPLALMIAGGGGVARAAPTPNGIYTILSPYSTNSGTGDADVLAAAAQTPCSASASASPYCYTGSQGATEAANGVFLRVNWCNFQPPATPNSLFANGCYYYINAAGNAPNAGGTATTCTTQFDTCPTGLLASTLKNIIAIDDRRHGVGLAHLKISLALIAGYLTATDILTASTVGSIALPALISQPNAPAAPNQIYDCVLLPNVFSGAYVTAYEAALDALINQIITFDNGFLASDLAIVKVAPVNTITEEFDMDGENQSFETSKGPSGTNLTCPPLGTGTTNSAAAEWLADFSNFPSSALDPNCIGTGLTIISATECAVGDVVGHTGATLANAGLTGVDLSIDTQNGQALLYLNCGSGGGTACTVQPLSSGDDWSIYYLYHTVKDLFTPGTQAYYAANQAAAAAGGSYALVPGALAMDFTSLNTTPIAPASQIVCGLNNDIPADDYTLTLNGNSTALPGVPGTLIGWQTTTKQGSTCPSPFSTTLANGITYGGQFIEIQTDIAFTDLDTCATPLNGALAHLLTATPPGTCNQP